MLKRYSEYGWTRKAICEKWDISVKTLYKINYDPKSPGPKRTQLNVIIPEEREAVRIYALDHTELRHREMSYRMIDENVAFISPSSVYRILKEFNLIGSRLKRSKPENWNPHKRVIAPDQVWQTDLMSLKYKSREYYLLSYMDVYSRYIVYWKLCFSMTGNSIRDATDEAINDTGIQPTSVQSDNGSCYISQEYRSLMDRLEIDHRFIHPHCPNENAEIERYHRTLRDLVDPNDAKNFDGLEQLVREQIYYYNHVRYHSRIGFIPPHIKYHGKPEKIFKEREIKLQRAKTNRIKINHQRWRVFTSSPETEISPALNHNFSKCLN